jgi:hypothetical protein
MVDRDALRTEALRIHARYMTEVVEALGFCPWAKDARQAGRVRCEVVFGSAGDAAMLERIQAAIAELEADEAIEIGLLVMPELSLGRLELQHFAAKVRERYRPASPARAFAIADFHPDAAPRLSSPAQLVPFIRKSPDPSLQLVRHSAIEAVRLGGAPGTRFVDAAALAEGGLALGVDAPSLSERVARANLRTVQELGVEQVEALFRELEADRDQSYARLGLPLPAWRSRR